MLTHFFFFSSRRRHTRYWRDWSSDVCSSDLLTGAEVGIAGGSAILGQKLLEAVFGDQAVRSLAERARQRLEASMRDLLDAERRRYTDLLDALEVSPEAPERMRSAARKVDDLRFASARRAPEPAAA